MLSYRTLVLLYWWLSVQSMGNYFYKISPSVENFYSTIRGYLLVQTFKKWIWDILGSLYHCTIGYTMITWSVVWEILSLYWSGAWNKEITKRSSYHLYFDSIQCSTAYTKKIQQRTIGVIRIIRKFPFILLNFRNTYFSSIKLQFTELPPFFSNPYVALLQKKTKLITKYWPKGYFWYYIVNC